MLDVPCNACYSSCRSVWICSIDTSVSDCRQAGKMCQLICSCNEVIVNNRSHLNHCWFCFLPQFWKQNITRQNTSSHVIYLLICPWHHQAKSATKWTWSLLCMRHVHKLSLLSTALIGLKALRINSATSALHITIHKHLTFNLCYVN